MNNLNVKNLAWRSVLVAGVFAELYVLRFAAEAPQLFHSLLLQHPRLGRLAGVAILLLVGAALFVVKEHVPQLYGGIEIVVAAYMGWDALGVPSHQVSTLSIAAAVYLMVRGCANISVQSKRKRPPVVLPMPELSLWRLAAIPGYWHLANKDWAVCLAVWLALLAGPILTVYALTPGLALLALVYGWSAYDIRAGRSQVVTTGM